jgi:hypothetical protein
MNDTGPEEILKSADALVKRMDAWDARGDAKKPTGRSVARPPETAWTYRPHRPDPEREQVERQSAKKLVERHTSTKPVQSKSAAPPSNRNKEGHKIIRQVLAEQSQMENIIGKAALKSVRDWKKEMAEAAEESKRYWAGVTKENKKRVANYEKILAAKKVDAVVACADALNSRMDAMERRR